MPPSKALNKTRLQRLRASCDGCFLAKVKCNKTRPICSRCLTCGINCKYSPSLRVGKPSADRQISHSNMNIANQDNNIDETLHSHLTLNSQTTSITSDKQKSPVFRFDTNWSISSGSAVGHREGSSSAIATPSLRGDSLLDTSDMAFPSSNTELFDPSFPWTPISQNEIDNLVFQNDQATKTSQASPLGALPQLNSFSPWFDSQPLDLPCPPHTNEERPLSNALFDAKTIHSRGIFSTVSSSSCNCFTSCLQALQALHNHSSTTQSIPAFDTAMTINRKAVEGCANMLACSKCVSKSGSTTTTMLLATIMEKILSFYQVVSQGNSGTMTAEDAQMSIGTYRVADEDGRWLKIEILWRELRKLEELFSRFDEVCRRNERDKDAGIYSTLISHLSQNLNFAYEELKMTQNSDRRIE